MMTLNNTSIRIMADSGTFKGTLEYATMLAFMLMCTGFIISKLEQVK